MSFYSFPKDFIFGCATSSIQVEGSPLADGAGETCWSRAARRPGFIKDDGTPETACDQFNRYREDAALMKELGIQAYRFSVNWARVFPDGDGKPNPKGLDYYNKLVDELLAQGITPFMTLHHWELPQSLQDRCGGWLSRRTPEAFGRFADHVCKNLGDRVKNYFSLNEINNFTESCYNEGGGWNPPTVLCSTKEKYQTIHNALIAHGLAVKAVRENVSGGKIGVSENSSTPVPVLPDEESIAAGREAFREWNAGKLTAICEGRYMDSYLEKLGPDAPDFTDEDMAIIGTPTDYIGLNIYLGNYFVMQEGKVRALPFQEGYPNMAMDWEKFVPDSAYWTLRFAAENWHPEALYVTENGCAAIDRVAQDTGEINDTARVLFIKEYLKSVCQAEKEGFPVKGYFAWSLMDNFEWKAGYEPRFGLVRVNYNTQERTPKLSAKFYAETIKRRILL